MSLVVQCPECFSPSRVELDAVGQMVACPGCQAPFIAVEEIVPTVQPKPRSGATRSSSLTKPSAALRPRSRPRPLPRPQEETPPEAHVDRPHTPDPVHDPHHAPIAGLPISVLVGLALLPFGIPLLWWAAPTVTGKAATLSIAVPVSLAIAASALCLGVVYTIDWTGTTRVKGVLMLVGLAYLSAAGLYFLKEDMMNRFRGFIAPDMVWRTVISDDGRFKVKMPARAEDAKEQPIPKVEMQAGKRAMYQSATAGEFRYVALNGVPENPPAEPPEPAWFTEIGNHLAKSNKIVNHSPVKNFHNGCTGYQWELQDGVGATRIVQVYAHKGRVYYLSVEGNRLSTTDTHVEPFFQSFEIVDVKR